MNKKLKIYSGLFLFSILFVVAFAVFTPTDNPRYSRAYSQATNAGDLRMTVEREGNSLVSTQNDTTYQVRVDSLGNVDTIGAVTNTKPRSLMWFDVNLRKCSHTNSLLITATNSRTFGLINIGKARIIIPSTRNIFIRMWVLTVVVYLIGLIWVIRLIVRVIKNIRKGNIFVSQMAVDLERLGVLMTIFFVVGFIGQIYNYFMACGIQLENYQVVLGLINGRAWLIAGTGLMLLSQIFSMGKDLKEDVDLTV